jgi:hypothetical protein
MVVSLSSEILSYTELDVKYPGHAKETLILIRLILYTPVIGLHIYAPYVKK